MGVHDAITVEFEAKLLPVVDENTEERFEVLLSSKQWLFSVASEDDMVDGGRGCESWRPWHAPGQVQGPCQMAGTGCNNSQPKEKPEAGKQKKTPGGVENRP
jgi:hypothetical protein